MRSPPPPARVNRYPDMATTALRDRIAVIAGVTAGVGRRRSGQRRRARAADRAVCDPGDEVVFAWRSFEAYPILCQIAGAVAVRVPLVDERHDLPAMAAAVTDRTRVVLLCSPNNPTGTAITEAELVDFLERVPSRVLVVLDEAYREFAGSRGTGQRRPARFAVTPTCACCGRSRRPTAWPVSGSGYAHRAPRDRRRACAGRRSRSRSATSPRPRRWPRWTPPTRSPSGSRRWSPNDHGSRPPSASWAGRCPRARRTSSGCAPTTPPENAWSRTSTPPEVMVRGYPGDGVRVTIADPASNDRVLAVLAGFER